MLVERNDDTTRWPKMDVTNCRSMELLRGPNRLNVGEGLREVGELIFYLCWWVSCEEWRAGCSSTLRAFDFDGENKGGVSRRNSGFKSKSFSFSILRTMGCDFKISGI